MKSKLIPTAIILFGLITACQKESSLIWYQIDHDGMWHSCASSNELFHDIHRLTSMCVDNHQITTTIDPQRKEPPVSKDVIRYQTDSQKDMDEWCKKMLENGYLVNVYYDKERGIWIGEAIR